jgi:hypothetical protein
MAKKPAFPSKPCPKCGKPIHARSKKHEDCGWISDVTAALSQNGAAKGEINKSAAAREILRKNPKTPVKEVVSTLAGQGIKISENYVYMLKSKAKARKRKEKREKAMVVTASGPVNPVDLVRDVKALALRAGGLRTLKQLVDVLAE